MAEKFDLRCNSGQGENNKSIHNLGPISLEMCGQECLEFDGCIGIDYTDNTDAIAENQCRMYNDNTPRSNPGENDRIYCTVGEGEKEFD